MYTFMGFSYQGNELFIGYVGENNFLDKLNSSAS